MKDLLISIIVPIYNVEQYLRQCIESIIEQTYNNLEVILVDDGSTDSCSEICDEYVNKDSRVSVIHKKNGGLSSARESGMANATGSYVMFVDGDDWIASTTVEECVREVAKSENITCVMFSYTKETSNQSIPMHIFDDFMYMSADISEEKVYRRLFGLSNDELSHPERMENVVSCCMKLYKSNYAKKGRYFDTKLVGSCEDGLFNMYALYGCREIIYLDRPLYHYRKIEGTLTSSFRPLFIQQWGTLFSIMEEIIDEKNLGEKYREALSNRIALSITAVGLNELRNKKNGHIGHIKVIRDYLEQERYQSAVSKLRIKEMPLTWKLLMISCKARCAIVVYMAIAVIEKLRKR